MADAPVIEIRDDSMNPNPHGNLTNTTPRATNTTQPPPGFLDDIDAKTEALQKSLVGPAQDAKRDQGYADRTLNDNAKEGRARMDQAWRQERAHADDPALRPWNADQERANRTHGPMEQFGSIGMIFAMAASAFTRAPMTSALNAGAAAMTAIQQGDEKAYKSAYDAWKSNSDLALKRFDMEHTLYVDADKLMSVDMNQWRNKTLQIATQFNDTKKIAMLERSLDPEVMQARSTMIDSAEKLRKAREGMEEFNEQQGLISEGFKVLKAEHPTWFGEKPTMEEVKAKYELIDNVKKSMKGQQLRTLTGPQEFTQRWWQEHPNGTAEEFSEAYSKFMREQKPQTGGGRTTESQDQVERIQERTAKYQSQGMSKEEAHSKAAAEIKEADSQARQTGKNRMDQSLVNVLEKYPGMERKDLGDILPTRQPKVIAAVIESPENLEAIAKFTKENPASLGLIAEASKRINLDAYQALFKSNPKAAEAKITADRNAAIDELAKERKLDLTQAAQAKVLQKMLTTQAFTDAALAGSRGATIYLDKAFKEIYDPNASPGAFFSILEKRYEEADRIAREYKLGFNDRSPEALKEMPFWTGKAAGYAGKLVTKPPAAGAVQSPDGKWYVESSPNAPGARKNKNGHWYTEVQ